MKRSFLLLLVGLISILCAAQTEARRYVRARTVTAPALYWNFYNGYYAPMAARAYNSIPPMFRPVRVYRQPGFIPQQPGYAPQQPGYSPQQRGTVSPQQPLTWQQQSVLRRQKLVAQRKKAAEERKKQSAQRKKLNLQRRAKQRTAVRSVQNRTVKKH